MMVKRVQKKNGGLNGVEKKINIPFPGKGPVKKFNKELLLKLSKEIKEELPELKVQWAECKLPLTLYDEPREVTTSSFEKSNLMRIMRGNDIIVEAYKLRVGSAWLAIYEEKLSVKEIKTISKILRKNGFYTIEQGRVLKKVRIYMLLLWGFIPIMLTSIPYFAFHLIESFIFLAIATGIVIKLMHYQVKIWKIGQEYDGLPHGESGKAHSV